MNKQQLASKIWESANRMRSKIEANEYKDYILGFIFYKYLSDKEIRFLKAEGFTEDDLKMLIEEDSETVNYIQSNIGYFIAYTDLFATWIDKGRDFDVSDVRDALSAFSRLINSAHKKVFDGVFNTLQTGLSKLGDSSSSQTKAISEIIHLIKDIPMDGKQDYDVLGFIYEYLISMFAANAGKKAGEFYTPHEVSLLMSEIVAEHLKNRSEIEIYDPTSGSGSLLINIGRSVAKHIDNKDNIKYYAQELKQNTYNLTRMNLVMRDILPDNIETRNGDTLEEDWPFFDENDPTNSYTPLYVDAVVSNPPYSQNWEPTNKETDPRYAGYGLAPKTKADYAFLLHELYHLKPHGIMTIVLPHGVLFRGGEEEQIRRNLIEKNHIDAIIGLPANIFFGTGIPTIIMVLKQKRTNTDVLIVDASKGFIKEGKNNKLRASDIKRIKDTVLARESIPNYAKKVSREEIRTNDYNLNIPRYVDSSEKVETWDLYASMFGGIPNKEIDAFEAYWKAFPRLREDLFVATTDAYSQLHIKEVKDFIKSHPDVQAFMDGFDCAFKDFGETLKNELLNDMTVIKLSKEEEILSQDIFKRLLSIPLVDPYEAYQLLDDEWNKINVDLEMIQTEGFEATKKVDANMVMKKKNSKEEEVQEGWKGHIIPFELIQDSCLKSEYEELKQHENRLLEIATQYTDILESLSEEDKENEAINEAADGFVAATLAKEVKQIKADKKCLNSLEEDSIEFKLISVSNLMAEEKALKVQIKSETARLHLKTKEVIENLSDEQVIELLKRKWINPLIEALYQLPGVVINELTNKIQILAEKYQTTYAAIEEQIQETVSCLATLIDDLTGDDYDMKGLSQFKELIVGE